MLKLYVTLQNLWADKRGVTAIEYAVLAGAVGTALVAISANGGWDAIDAAITGALDEISEPGGT